MGFKQAAVLAPVSFFLGVYPFDLLFVVITE